MLGKRYRISENNQLGVMFPGSGSSPDTEVIVPGRFWIEDDNQLVYIIEESAYLSAPYYLPRKIIMKGEWTISPDHRLGIRPKTAGGSSVRESTLYLRGEFVEVGPDKLSYVLSESQPGYKLHVLTLRGKWQSDAYNRLTFLAEKRSSRYETLTFEGIWQVRHNTLSYRLRHTAMKRIRKQEDFLTFKGYWRIDDKSRLAYVMNKDATSGFDFSVSLESPSMRGKEGEIRYRLGIGYKKHRREKTIVLSGTWKFSPRVGLQFTLDYGGGTVHSLAFQTVVKRSQAQTLTLGLRNLQGKDLGIRVTFSKSFFQEKAQWFLRWIDQEGGRRLEGGITIPW